MLYFPPDPHAEVFQPLVKSAPKPVEPPNPAEQWFEYKPNPAMEVNGLGNLRTKPTTAGLDRMFPWVEYSPVLEFDAAKYFDSNYTKTPPTCFMLGGVLISEAEFYKIVRR